MPVAVAVEFVFVRLVAVGVFVPVEFAVVVPLVAVAVVRLVAVGVIVPVVFAVDFVPVEFAVENGVFFQVWGAPIGPEWVTVVWV
jgi:hypothetical protein